MPNPPMNPANYMIAAIDLYVQWLNLWAEAEGDDFRYTVHMFTVYDPERNLHGHAEFIALTPLLWDCYLLQCVISDGDEGGSHEILAWVQIDTIRGTNMIHDMVQGFDTQRQFIIRGGKFLNIPGIDFEPSDN